MGAIGAEDGFFVAFAEDENEVAFLGEGNGFFDSGFSVDDFEDLGIFHTGFFTTIFEHVHDFFWRFITRIVFGKNTDIAVFASNFATFGTSGFVTSTSTAEEGNDATRWMRIDGGKDFFEGVGSVGKIDDDVEILSEIEAIHATQLL